MHTGHRERMKERYFNESLDGFSDFEVLELLLFYSIPRIDVNPIAHELIENFGSLPNILNAKPFDLVKVKGVGKNSSILLSVIGRICSRLHLQSAGKRPRLNTPERAMEYCEKLLSNKKSEHLYVLLLDNQQRLILSKKISSGGPNSTEALPRSIVEAALTHGAAYVALTHNHPGGSPIPSAADIATTERIAAALAHVDVRFTRHFIVADGVAHDMQEYIEASKEKETIKTKSLPKKSAQQMYASITEADGTVNPYELLKLIKMLDKKTISDVINALSEQLEGDNPYI